MAIEPSLFAAGGRGAMLEIFIHSAANISAVSPRAGEEEYLLPRDCRCRVVEVVPERLYNMKNGDSWTGVAIRLEQV
jgi:hypothetical protein